MPKRKDSFWTKERLDVDPEAFVALIFLIGYALVTGGWYTIAFLGAISLGGLIALALRRARGDGL